MRNDDEGDLDPVIPDRAGSTFTCRSMNASPTTFDLLPSSTHSILYRNNHGKLHKLIGAKARVSPLRLPRQHLYECL
jgi:hypothetical protein